MTDEEWEKVKAKIEAWALTNVNVPRDGIVVERVLIGRDTVKLIAREGWVQRRWFTLSTHSLLPDEVECDSLYDHIRKCFAAEARGAALGRLLRRGT